MTSRISQSQNPHWDTHVLWSCRLIRVCEESEQFDWVKGEVLLVEHKEEGILLVIGGGDFQWQGKKSQQNRL